MRHRENQRAGIALLVAMAIDLKPQVKRVRVGDLIAGHQPRAKRAEGIEALALVPCAAALELPFALGHIIDHAVASDVLHCIGFVDVTPALAYHDAHFHFPVGLERATRDLDVIVRAADGAGPFIEDDRLFRDFHIGFGGVVGVVQADADELADLPDAGADTRLTRHQRQACRVKCRKASQAGWAQRIACDIFDVRGEIADLVACIQQAGLFSTFFTVT
ncbi:hypothetical protein ALP57_200100 [Pseudomonas coronafaciens pv. oryzae]|nr:hypothetical protein ALP57_200100 [Pseudomonas coronafaciens pv. oryzae]